ncbi:lipoprotein [Sphingomonas sp. DBB INV C78]|uniref:DUF4394 domain-containing protein n=1 Tax=Sphingomonas sp. DBB INV C78 TaxID=3349434 RepID=UPI0036D25562
MRRSALCAITLAILAPTSAAQAQTAYGLLGSDRIVTFDAAAPGTIITNQAITGLGAGEVLTGIDIRPANGLIYTVATSGNLYSLSSGPGAYAATLVGNIGTPIIGSNFGIDFNPVPDRLRFVSDGDQNLRINPNNAVTLTDGSINPSDLNLIGSAYINNFAGATATTLFGIDSLTASLVRSTNPNAGTYISVGSLGLGAIGTDARVGFDVFTSSGVNTAYLALNDQLYTVNLTTGAATAVGAIGADDIRGLTLRLGFVPEPSTWAMMICGFGMVGSALRRPAGRATLTA